MRDIGRGTKGDRIGERKDKRRECETEWRGGEREKGGDKKEEIKARKTERSKESKRG